MHQQVKPWHIALGVLVAVAVLFGIGSRALRPAPIRSQAPAGTNPLHYEVEFGPRPGQLEEMKRAGLVPADAIDDGRGHFVSPSRLTPAERELAAQLVARRQRNSPQRRRGR